MIWRTINKIIKQVSREVSSTNLAFSSIIVRKDRQKLNKSLSEANTDLKIFCLQESIDFINNKNISESCLAKNKFLL